MDRVVFIAMTGAREVTRQQAVVTHNLANVSTQGFKAELSVFRALPVAGEGAKTRAFVAETTPASDFAPGSIRQTGRALDVAVKGRGWIAVQDASGQEAYTRMGHIEVSPNGIMQTLNGRNILGDGGVIAVQPEQALAIGKDGTVSSMPIGANQNAVEIVGRIKLVNPDEAQLVRGDDGLFRLRSGEPAQADAAVQLESNALEGSNVNPAEALVSMIGLARQFELQLKVVRTADENHKSADKILAR